MEGKLIHKRDWYWIVGLVVIVCLLFVPVSSVQAAERDDDGTIEAGEIIDDDAIVTGETVTIDGTVNGMLLAFGNTVTINGTINGDVLAMGSTVKISKDAEISGNIFAGGQLVELDTPIDGSFFAGGAVIRLGENAKVARNVFGGSYDFTAEEGSTVGKDLYAGAYQVLLVGTVERDVNIGAGALDIEGKIGRNLKAEVGSPQENTSMVFGPQYYLSQSGIEVPAQREMGLRIADSAEIGGDLSYTSSYQQEEAFQVTPHGEIIYQTPVPDQPAQTAQAQVENNPSALTIGLKSLFKWLLDIFRNFVTLAILGGLALWLVPGPIQKASEFLQKQTWKSLGYGAASFFGGYVALLIVGICLFLVGLFFTIITLNGVSKIFFGGGFAGLTLIGVIFHYLVWYGSKLVLAFLVGNFLMTKIAPNASNKNIWGLFLGIIIVVILRGLPIVGSWLINPIIALFGIGAICLYLLSLRKPSGVSATAITEGETAE